MSRIGEAVDDIKVDEDGWTMSVNIDELAKINLTEKAISQSNVAANRSGGEERALGIPTTNRNDERLEELRLRFLRDKVERFKTKMKKTMLPAHQ